ncbi:uncharacterized protein ATC70_012983 [Mucor velutinosus]|uniref:Uncharacterized protein n=1 Tax=Mucor velutinosus TaxID=708070 RepID=A0AAN7HYB0_9FUNG|nr:hypothetical protein ATC70_012983 [Mucor velutinosus]
MIMKGTILFIINALFLVMTTAQFNDDINTNSISFVTPIADTPPPTLATTTAAESDNTNAILPAVTMTVTEVSTITTFPKQTTATSSTTATTTSNDASRLFMMKSSQLAAIVVLAYLVFLI